MGTPWIFAISFILLLIAPSGNFKSKASLRVRTPESIKNWNRTARSFYIATQSGYKKELPRIIKIELKKLGLIHLLTPSGIHLSSLLIFLFIFIRRRNRLVIYIFASFFILPLVGFYSLKRILIFHLLKSFIKSNKVAFLSTFAIDLLFGGYLNSPLSFTYSFLCWGVIIFSPSKGMLIINLFLSQIYINYFNSEEINFLSIILNPILTSIFSLFFPLMSFNFWVFKFDFLFSAIYEFINLFIGTVQFLNQHTYSMLFTPFFPMLLVPFIKPLFNGKALFIYLFISSQNLNIIKMNNLNSSKKHYLGLALRQELIKAKRNKLNFIDRNCSKKLDSGFWRISCNKKALHLGGLDI